MRFYVSCDIEGTNGICDWEETKRGSVGYPHFARMMTDEVAAACRGLNKAAPECEITVKDAHDSARNIDHALLPENTTLIRGWGSSPLSMMFGVDEGYDAAVFTGYHSPAGRGGNPLAHTMNTELNWIVINDVLASEFLINYYTSLYYGVPVVMVTGDAYLCHLAEETDPEILTVAAFTGRGGSAAGRHPNIILRTIEEKAALAVENRSRLKVELPTSFNVKIRFRRHQAAARGRYYPGSVSVDDHTLGFDTDDYHSFLTFLMFVSSGG